MPQAYGRVRNGVRASVKSVPKLVRVNADDDRALIFRNLGNGRRLPLLWGITVTLASGTQEIVVASGIEFHNFKICDGKIEITPVVEDGCATTYPDTAILGKTYVVKDTTLNQVIIKSTVAANAECPFDVYVFFGCNTTFSDTDSNQIWKRSYSL